MRNIATALIAILLYSSAFGRTTLHTIADVNCTPHALNSHAEAEYRSSLEVDYTTKHLISNEELDIRGGAVYSRIKRLSNGEYLLLCQGNHIGSYIS